MVLPPMMRALAAGGLAGAGLTAYAVWETRAFCLRDVTIPLLPPGQPSLRVLHLSDIHLNPGQQRKQDWLAGLCALEPDLVVNTGDNIAHPDSIPRLRDSLGPLLDLPGVFVFGSNDYYSPTLRNPLRYLLPDNGKRHTDSALLPWRELRELFTGSGWLDLTNQRASLKVGATRFAFAGVDDPHLRYDRLDEVCVPGVGALTTNCDLEPARAKGLHRHPARSRPGDRGSTWLHVSAGLGTSPYAQIRVACRPEATLLTLTSRD